MKYGLFVDDGAVVMGWWGEYGGPDLVVVRRAVCMVVVPVG